MAIERYAPESAIDMTKYVPKRVATELEEKLNEAYANNEGWANAAATWQTQINDKAQEAKNANDLAGMFLLLAMVTFVVGIIVGCTGHSAVMPTVVYTHDSQFDCPYCDVRLNSNTYGKKSCPECKKEFEIQKTKK